MTTNKEFKQKFTDLRKVVRDTEIEYRKVTFPIHHERDGVFTFDNDRMKSFLLTDCGVGYVHERTKRDIGDGGKAFSYGRFTKLLSEEKFDELASTMNEAIVKAKRLVGRELIAAFYNNHLVGILTNYNPIAHVELVKEISDAGLASSIRYYNMNHQTLDVDIQVRGSLEKNTLISLRIQNGHSGHIALKYYAVMRCEGYEFKYPLKMRNRHLSQVGVTFFALKEMMKQTGEIRIDEVLHHKITGKEFLEIMKAQFVDMSKRQEEIFNYVERAITWRSSAMEALIEFSSRMNERGFKGAIEALLDTTLEHIIKNF